MNLTLAKDAATAAAANGAGITVGGASANIYYSSSDDRWNFNKTVNGTITTANNSSYLGGVAAANYLQTTGSGSSLTSLPAGNLTGTIPSGVLGNSSVYIGTTSIALNRSSASQTLTGVSIDGSAGSATTATSATTAGTVTTAAQGNITSVGTLTGLTVSGNVSFTGADVSLGAVGNLHISGGSAGHILTTDGAGTLSWVAAGTATSAQYVTNASQGNITTTANLVSVGNITTGTWSANIGAVSGANLTAVPGANITGTISSSVLGNSTVYIGTTAIALNRSSASQSLTGINIDGSAGTAGTVTTAAQGNITSVGTLTSLTVSGAIKPNANGTVDLGDGTHYFGTIYGLATSAKYADVAEIYVADKEYEPGTVVMFGGEKEITATYIYGSTAVAGVISTNPAYLMNNETAGLPVALLGRVPCKVVGPVSKGDFIVSSNMLGVGIGSKFYIPGAVIGKSLVNKDTDQVELIEVVVGRL